MVAYIDIEVRLQSGRVTDYGVVRSDGATLHTRERSAFEAFVDGCTTVCGHNILRHDLRYVCLSGRPAVVDTLPLSPLLFPQRPYHRLVKDDKLQVDQWNNPVCDAEKARDLLADEVSAWQGLSPARRALYGLLLSGSEQFAGFFRYVGYSSVEPAGGAWASALRQMVLSEYEGRVCSHADFARLARTSPVELAYSLAVIGTDDTASITPAWVTRNYPEVAAVMAALTATPCGACPYCRRRLSALVGLKEYFGYDTFRTFGGVAMQQQAVECALRGGSLLTVFPTGGGKSLTFQLPALMAGRNMRGLTVVISPLQSLMKDQVDNLAARGISEAVTINGLLDPIERQTAISQVADGSAHLLYIAPEMLRSATVEHLLLGRQVVRFVIDEAHCFSAWGHDFRVDYLYIGDFIRRLQERRQSAQRIAVSCFTATAKPRVISDIRDYFRRKLGLELEVFAASAERQNLHYGLLHAASDGEKYDLLRALVAGHACPTIVYVSRTRRTRELADHLMRDGIRAVAYHGQMEPTEKVRNQDAFMAGDVQVVVATSAFGMGVDKSDVGLVVHYDISDSLENYVQEAGRAGRDPSMQADCYVLYADSDLDKHFILLNQTRLSLGEVQQVWKAVRDLTSRHKRLASSPLDVARQAGWPDRDRDIETRVKASVAALEEAGYVVRRNNAPHVYATGILVGSMDEARRRLGASRLFDSGERETSARIIKALISARATAQGRGAEAESRVDYLADILGLTNADVIRDITLMRQAGLLADSRDMQARLSKATTQRQLEAMARLERFLLGLLADGMEQGPAPAAVGSDRRPRPLAPAATQASRGYRMGDDEADGVSLSARHCPSDLPHSMAADTDDLDGYGNAPASTQAGSDEEGSGRGRTGEEANGQKNAHHWPREKTFGPVHTHPRAHEMTFRAESSRQWPEEETDGVRGGGRRAGSDIGRRKNGRRWAWDDTNGLGPDDDDMEGLRARVLNYKEVNEAAHHAGLARCNVRLLRLLLHFLRLRGYVDKREHHPTGSVMVWLKLPPAVAKARVERRHAICRFAIDMLHAGRDAAADDDLVCFSVVEMHRRFVESVRTGLFADHADASIADVEEALLYLTKMELMKIEGGFLVCYNTMQIECLAERQKRYGKDQYRLLDEFYRHRIRQIHFVGEYARLMEHDAQAALAFVGDYFSMDDARFVRQYFGAARRAEIDRNITSAQYERIFGRLSDRQRAIIDDRQSRYVVVAAGPGSGKTHVLVCKLAALLLLDDVKHDGLLMLTFSRAAATEFKKRLIELVGNAAHYVDIKTFHSYCFDLIGQQGSLDQARGVVRLAAEMIERGEVEHAKIAKTVLVIDEAQDMGADDFRLVEALMRANEEMRVVAVGDDDQNIFAFRGSDARYMVSLTRREGARLYEMVDNYRSARAIVDHANRYAALLPGRLKREPIRSATGAEGEVAVIPTLAEADLHAPGSKAILTRTNEEALQVAYALEQRGLRASVVQPMGGFYFSHLAEVRYFLRQLTRRDLLPATDASASDVEGTGQTGDGQGMPANRLGQSKDERITVGEASEPAGDAFDAPTMTIPRAQWDEAKRRTLSRYGSGRSGDVMRRFFADFEATHRSIYMSDLREFIFESSVDDFVSADAGSIFVGTIHKAKGREFDTVYMLAPRPDGRDACEMRAYYVGLTRARRSLYLVADPTPLRRAVLVPLGMRDVQLGFFNGRKQVVLQLRSGDRLHWRDGCLYDARGRAVAMLSVAARARIGTLVAKGYAVAGTEVSYVVAWRPPDQREEYAVCLANLVLVRPEPGGQS